jgi:hypothetical protein
LIADQAKVGAMNKKMRRTFVPNYSRAAKHWFQNAWDVMKTIEKSCRD